MGIPEANTFVLEDGDVLELDADGGEVVDWVPAGHVLVDGPKLWNMDSEVLGERRHLSREGVVTVAVTLDAQTGKALKSPYVVSSGFTEDEESRELFEKTSKEILTVLDQPEIHRLELDEIKAKISDCVSKMLRKEARRNPAVLTIIERL